MTILAYRLCFPGPLHYSTPILGCIPVLSSLALQISLSSELKNWIMCDLTQIPPLRSNPRSSRSALGRILNRARVSSCQILPSSQPPSRSLILNPSHRPLEPCTFACNERLSGYDRFPRSLFKFSPSKPCKRRLDPGCMATE